MGQLGGVTLYPNIIGLLIVPDDESRVSLKNAVFL
jgi:hypothetical protein